MGTGEKLDHLLLFWAPWPFFSAPISQRQLHAAHTTLKRKTAKLPRETVDGAVGRIAATCAQPPCLGRK